MKFALVVLVILPFALGAPVDERQIDGIDIYAMAKQMLAQMGTDEVENQCETSACPTFMENTLHVHSQLFESLTCVGMCNLAQTLAKAGR